MTTTRFLFPQVVRAVVFDVDGTLYDQRTLRVRMAWSLARSFPANPREQFKVCLFLKAYREAQEQLRSSTAPERDLASRQLELACGISATPLSTARQYLERWFEREPLKHLMRMTDAGTRLLIERARSGGLALGVYSDYPSVEKLKALGLEKLFDVITCSSDPGIGTFKPNPLGLQRTLQRLGVCADEAVYIGDRVDVDAPCAWAAGAHAVIIGKSAKSSAGITRVRSLQELPICHQPACSLNLP